MRNVRTIRTKHSALGDARALTAQWREEVRRRHREETANDPVAAENDETEIPAPDVSEVET